ncbi:dockerin type I repeat-containing protein [Lachnospiraceae bacterium 48-21]
MRRYFKRAIAVLVIALMCSTLIGGGVLAEIESENDINNEVNVEEIGGNEDVPEISPEEKSGTVSGETEGEELETNVEEARSGVAGAVSAQSDECPVQLTIKSEPSSISEAYPVPVNLGDTIEYYVQVKNVHDKDDLTNVEVKIHIDNSLEADVSTAKYNLTSSTSAANQHTISGSSGYSARLEGNDVVFKANQLSWDDAVMFHITCNTKSEGTVSSKASVCSVGGVSYSGIESSSTYHNVRQEVSDFTLSTRIDGNGQYMDGDRVFTYNFNLIKDGKGLTTSLPYKLVYGGDVVSEHTLELENGIGSVSFPARYQFKTESMPTGVNYQITHKEDNNYTWNKESVTGTTDLSGSNESFNATYKYSPVKYSLDTNIIVNMEGRNFKAGDSFTYSIAPEKEGDPIFNKFPYPYGDTDTPAYFEGIARVKPSSGSSITLPLEENIERVSGVKCSSCGRIYRVQAEYLAHVNEIGCGGGFSGIVANMNTSPEIKFIYPGTYNYIVFQTTMESSDYDSIQKDQTQYKVTVTVTANGSSLTPSLTSVKRSTDGGKTWSKESDTSKLTFTNYFGVKKGDIDKDGEITMNDVILCLNHVSKKKILTGEALAAADVDGNGVSMNDVIKLLNFVSKKNSDL